MHRLGSTAPAGGWAADQHQSPDLRLGASKAGENIAGNTSLGGKNTQCYCREPFPGLGEVQSCFILLPSMAGYKQSLCAVL